MGEDSRFESKAAVTLGRFCTKNLQQRCLSIAPYSHFSSVKIQTN
jgi:hypothetical protein